MKTILFIHQNFPAQFKSLAPSLVKKGYSVTALTLQSNTPGHWQGVRVIHYSLNRHSSAELHPWVADYEAKVIRGEAVFRRALALKHQGYHPDLIIAHPGWGEALLIRDVWPNARLALYGELYYQPDSRSHGFDPEFPQLNQDYRCKLRLKNACNLLSLEQADAVLSPTHWQAATFPESYRNKTTVIHDGIATEVVKPDPDASLTINGTHFTGADEVVTFVNRNLEPHRGYHIFMRTLPLLLKQRPHARIIIVGGSGCSYGAPPPGEKSWKQTFIDEVRPGIPDCDWERVIFSDQLPYTDFISLLQISTVHVYLTYPFIVGWSLLEAMSAECSVIANATEPVLEFLEHEKDAILVDFFSVLDLSRQICRLLDSPELRARLGKAAREKILAAYDLSSVSLPAQHRWIDGLLSTNNKD